MPFTFIPALGISDSSPRLDDISASDVLLPEWTRSWSEERLAPKMACTPLQPSLPIVAISMILPSASVSAPAETTPLSGKKTLSSEVSASIFQDLRALAANLFKLRHKPLKIFREGSASESRSRGHFDEAFVAI